MPLYEYSCNQCGSQFEKMVRLSEIAQKPVCPRCGSVQTNKQLSRIAAPASAGTSASATSSCSTSSSSFR